MHSTRMLAACVSFERQHARHVSEADAEAVWQLLHTDAKAAGIMPADNAQAVMTDWLCGGEEFAPVCAVVGGVAANNVVKAVSHSGAPLHNCFYFSLFDGRGVVEQHPAEAVANGHKAKVVIETIDLDDD